MSRAGILALALGLVASVPLFAQATEVGTDRKFGLGFQLGQPTAIVGKGFLGNGNALDVGLGFGGLAHYGAYCRDNNNNLYRCGGYKRMGIHGDFLWQENLLKNKVQLDWHIGVGGRVSFYDYNGSNREGVLSLFARMPLGLDLTFDRPKFLEVFFEIAPGLFIFPGLVPDMDVALGVRFYF